MPAEAKSPSAPAPLSDANADTPKKKQSTGKAALARVTLLDGAVVDVTIDVRSIHFRFHSNINYRILNCSERRKARTY